jgi:hypothetical protein
MAIGRHLNDRAHVVTRQRSTRTGDFDENQDYINFDEGKVMGYYDHFLICVRARMCMHRENAV